MGTTSKKAKTIEIDIKDLPDYTNYPGFKNILEDARQIIIKHGLPESTTKEIIKLEIKMGTTSKKAEICGIVVKKLPDYGDYPGFKKKFEEAKEFIRKHGLPESITSS